MNSYSNFQRCILLLIVHPGDLRTNVKYACDRAWRLQPRFIWMDHLISDNLFNPNSSFENSVMFDFDVPFYL